MKYYYVYIHICLPDAKAYIGWSANPKNRWGQHCAAKDNRPFYNAIRKYGKECFESQILFRTTSLKEVKQKEIDFIKQFDTLVPNGYNLTKGGDGATGVKWSEKAKEKVRGRKNALGYKHTKKELERRKGNKYAPKKNPAVSKSNRKRNKENNPMKDSKARLKQKISCLKTYIKRIEQKLEERK